MGIAIHRVPLLVAILLALLTCALSCEPSRSISGSMLHAATIDRPMLLIAHRGASGLAPEHTLASFDLAVEIGADYLEQDLQQTRDGVLVILHDDTLDRTARGPADSCRGLVREKTLAQLESCDFGSWFVEKHPETAGRFDRQGILTLEALIDRFGSGVRYYIETKNPEEAPGMEESLLAILSRRGLLEDRGEPPRVFLQSFSTRSLRDLAARAPTTARLQLLDRRSLRAPYDEAVAKIATYADGIGPHFSDVDRALVEVAHRHGLEVHAYTVNDPGEMQRLIGLGVDAIFSDFPDRFRALKAGAQVR